MPFLKPLLILKLDQQHDEVNVLIIDDLKLSFGIAKSDKNIFFFHIKCQWIIKTRLFTTSEGSQAKDAINEFEKKRLENSDNLLIDAFEFDEIRISTKKEVIQIKISMKCCYFG